MPTTPETLPMAAAQRLAQLRARRPLVHCLMNTVVQKLVADGLSALGAIPSMTSAPEQVASFVEKADALVVNLGTLDRQRQLGIDAAVEAARTLGKPWVLDPAHCEYSPDRAAYARQLLGYQPAVLKANTAEHAVLGSPPAIVSVVTGATDQITHGKSSLSIENGHALMPAVTGTGCLSGAVIAAFFTLGDEPADAAACAMLVMGVAAEIAGARARGPGSFEPELLDALHGISEDDIIALAKVSHAED